LTANYRKLLITGRKAQLSEVSREATASHSSQQRLADANYTVNRKKEPFYFLHSFWKW